MKRLIFYVLILIVAAINASGCVSPSARNDRASIRVLASATFLADIAQNVAGDRLKVESLLPVGVDPHAFQPAPVDVSRIAESDVLILNGLEYERFMEILLKNAGGERLIIEAAAGLEAKAGDPHMWLDPNLVVAYAENIRAGLSQFDPEGAGIYESNAEAYIAQLKDLDAFIREQVERIPAERRLLATNHEALGYFAERYGFEIVDTILPSFSSEAGASAQEIAAAIEAIRASGAPAIFLSEAENADLANQIAAETGAKVVNTLYLESLTEGDPAPTYIAMMKYNVTQIAGALK